MKSAMEGVTYRNARPDDWDAVARLLTAAGLPLDGAREWLDGFILGHRGRTLVASAAMERYGDVGLLRSVATSDEERGRGTGKAIVRQCLERARGGGVSTVVLLTTTAPAFFERLGFERIAREAAPAETRQSVQFTQATCASAVVMRLDLIGSAPATD